MLIEVMSAVSIVYAVIASTGNEKGAVGVRPGTLESFFESIVECTSSP